MIFSTELGNLSGVWWNLEIAFQNRLLSRSIITKKRQCLCPSLTHRSFSQHIQYQMRGYKTCKASEKEGTKVTSQGTDETDCWVTQRSWHDVIKCITWLYFFHFEHSADTVIHKKLYEFCSSRLNSWMWCWIKTAWYWVEYISELTWAQACLLQNVFICVLWKNFWIFFSFFPMQEAYTGQKAEKVRVDFRLFKGGDQSLCPASCALLSLVWENSWLRWGKIVGFG